MYNEKNITNLVYKVSLNKSDKNYFLHLVLHSTWMENRQRTYKISAYYFICKTLKLVVSWNWMELHKITRNS